MRISIATERYTLGFFEDITIRQNPSKDSGWFVNLFDNTGMPHILVDELDKPVIETDLNDLVRLLKTMGLKDVRIIF
jgi:hypothetical protein